MNSRSLWIPVSNDTTSGSRPPRAMATPIVELASSTSPYAVTRASVFAVRLISPSAVVPSSPVLVYMRVRWTVDDSRSRPASEADMALTLRSGDGAVRGDRGRTAGRRRHDHRREEQRAQGDGGGAARRGHDHARQRARHHR